MAKKPKLPAITVGKMVAFNTLDDATWFEVIAIDGFKLTIRQRGANYADQYIDKSCVVAVNDPVVLKLRCINNAGLENGLTVGKVYDSYPENNWGEMVTVNDDEGYPHDFHPTHFEKVEA